MSKILINQTALPVTIADTGQTVPASGQLTIPPQLYDLYAASNNVITLVSDLAVGPTTSTLVVNDGSANLTISDGVDLIKGIFPAYRLSSPTITLLSMPTAGTEYSFTTISGTLEVRFKARNRSKLQYSYISGQSGTTSFRITPGNQFTRTRLSPSSNVTFYIQATKDNETLEIETWT